MAKYCELYCFVLVFFQELIVFRKRKKNQKNNTFKQTFIYKKEIISFCFDFPIENVQVWKKIHSDNIRYKNSRNMELKL